MSVYVATLTLPETLAEIRKRGLRLEVADDKLRCGPTASLTDPLREALRAYKHTLLPILRTWGPETGLHVLYLLYEAVPSEPFQLDQTRFVSDPVSLRRCAPVVPGGLPAHPDRAERELQKDLRLLYRRDIR